MVGQSKGGDHRSRIHWLPILFLIKRLGLLKFTSTRYAIHVLGIGNPDKIDITSANHALKTLEKIGLVYRDGLEHTGARPSVMYSLDWEAVKVWMRDPLPQPCETIIWELAGEDWRK